ncbi:MAG TPA: bifunctional oligoribonuclease/PAP phosphatase NrnA, partial [Candidatus Methylacidiphilales bacterium]|nr:bifunctional oligoribonuclease/PAP phosphatase NrnA [Candidatus Methylacidiphilales bacterium]
NSDLLKPFQELCQQRQRFLVISHVRPDGDAYGSTLGLGLCLRALGKTVLHCNADGLSPLFDFLPGSAGFVSTPATPPESSCLIIAVDCADHKRLGPVFDTWKRLPDVNIDHHISNRGYANLNFIDSETPATAQVLYEMITALEWPLTADIAANLYVGLMTDTGSFRYRQTTARSFEIAARLVEAGADPTALAESCYQSFRAERLFLLREVLNQVRFANRNRIAWFYISPEVYSRSGAIPDEAEGLIENLQTIRSVEVAFVLESMPDGLTRASLRSRGRVDVQKISAQFGGGGHVLAAGLRTKLDPSTLETKLIELIAEQLPA